MWYNSDPAADSVQSLLLSRTGTRLFSETTQLLLYHVSNPLDGLK